MKKEDFDKVKNLDIKELRGKAKLLRKELADVVMDKHMNKLKDKKMVVKKKKELARVLTVMRQKELLGQLESLKKEVVDNGR